MFEIDEGDKLAVRHVAFAGNNAFPANKLEGAVKSGETNLLSFLLNNDNYDSDRIENDRDLLRQFYLAHGYADVRVTSSANYDAAKKGVVLTFSINEGPQYRVGAVDIQSSLKVVDATTLRSSLRTQLGDVYNADAVNKTVDDLAMRLARDGQPFAAVAVRDERVPAAHLINLIYTVEQGKRIYVERIDIHGNSKTHDDVIRREFDFNEGDAYNRALLDRAERRLKALGYFKSVKIEPHQGSAPDRVVLDVDVQEQGTGRLHDCRRLFHHDGPDGAGCRRRQKFPRYRRYREGVSDLRRIRPLFRSRFHRPLHVWPAGLDRHRSFRQPNPRQPQSVL